MKGVIKQESDDTTISLSEFNNMEIKRLEALKRPTYEVRKKNTKEKKREYIQPDEELTDSEGEIFKGSIIPSDDIEINDMTKLTKQISKAQEEYMSNNKPPDLSMYKVKEVLRPEDIEPTYEVRMKTARQKKQEKYDKLASKAF